jgi:hypothetical protein
MQLQVQDENKLQRKLDVNQKMLRSHENKVKDHLKLLKRRRFKTVPELEEFFNEKNAADGLELSYAEKCLVLRDQIQIRKKLDGIKKVGDTALHNCTGKEHPEPFDKLMEFFTLMCGREAAHGIPPPVQPQLMDQRKTKPGAGTLATKLLKQQHEQAAALTNAFYINHSVEEDGEFFAYKMCRTLVNNPKSYVGLAVKRFFRENETWYEGKIAAYYDPGQFWVVQYGDGDKEDWSAADMKQRVPTFVSGPIVDGHTERTGAAVRERTRQRKRKGRPNPVAEVLQGMIPMVAAAEAGATFELPASYRESVGTVWKLLRTEVRDDTSRWGAYMPADEAAVVDPDDLRNFTMEELQDSYDITLAPLDSIEAWIQTSAVLSEAVNNNPNARVSRRVRQQLPEVTPNFRVFGHLL